MKKLLFFLSLIIFYIQPGFGQITNTERNVLIGIYIESQGNLWLNNTNWNTTLPASTWFGITTEVIGGVERVTEIDLTGNNLNGTLPSFLSNLINLKKLKLGNNQIEGSINLSSATSLTSLQLNDNEISSLQVPPNSISINNGEFNIKNNPNLGCVQISTTALNNLSLQYIDLGTVITSNCNGVNNLPQSEKDALNDLYANTNGSSWYDHTYKITDATLNLQNKGFTYVDIAGTRHVSTIALNQNSLNGAISSSFGDFTELTSLKLNNNNINNIPEELSNLTKLETLYLNNNYQITTLPTNLGNLSNLTELYIQNCNFNSLPASIYNLANLSKFNFANNDITLLPPEIGNLTGLTELIASPNPFPSVPNEMGNLTQLTILDLAGSLITNIPAGFGNLTNLQELYLHNNNLQIIFENGMGNLTQLTKLTLADNSLTQLPNDIGNLTLLTELTLRNNLLTSLPDGIGNLTLLTELDLYYSNLTVLPVTIGNLTGLTSLNLYSNELTSLPTTIGNLVNLNFLDLGTNQLTSLPTEIGNLTNLQSLLVDSQRLPSGVRTLTAVPSSISNLSSLTTLNLSNNAITGAIDLSSLTSLSYIQLGSNQISGLTLGVDAITTFNNFNLANNPFLTCVQVPTSQVANWNSINFGLDNGVIFSDNCSGGNFVPQTERQALIDIYNAFKDTYTWLNWSTDINEAPLSNTGAWSGITTAQVNGVKHVVEINLFQNGIASALPSTIENFTELTKLTITTNSGNKAKVSSLPTTIGNLPNLTDLNFRYNDLTSLPNEIGNLQNLERLNLYQGNLTTLPSTIGGLSNLKLLEVSNNKLTTLPTDIGNLSALETLNIQSNKITSLPTQIGALSSLLTLNVSRQYYNATYTLTTIPTEINNITTLTSLNLSSNALVGDLDFSNLLALNIINLSGNEITGVKFGVPPTNFCSSSNCFYLKNNPNLSCIEVPTAHLASWQASSFINFIDNGVAFSDNCANNNIPQLEREALIAIYNALANGTGWTNWNTDPNSLSNVGAWTGVTTDFVNGAKHVTMLKISGFQIYITNSNALPIEIANLPELLELELSSYYSSSISLTALPAEIGNLVKLTKLTLNYNNLLTSLPDEIGNLSSLEELYMNQTAITSLPATIGNLSNLTSLSTYLCPIQTLPTTIGNLTSLTSLSIHGGELTSLPPETGNLSNLTTLTLSSNNLTSLPTTIGTLSSLTGITITSNALTSLPSEINNITTLTQIGFESNQIEGTINFDALVNLTNLNMRDNQISSIKLAVGALGYNQFYLNNNPYLTCIEVPTVHLAAWETSGLIGNGGNTDNGVIVSDACGNNNVPNSERLALLTIYASLANSTGWPNWDTDTNGLTNVGSWNGVSTSVVNGQKHVTKLIIGDYNSAGNITNSTALPAIIEDLPELLKLTIGGTTTVSLTALPTEIGNLTKLTELKLSRHQQLTSLPTTIGQLDALEILDFNNCSLASLPVEIGNLNSIITINLRENEITNLPLEIGNNNTLEVLNLDYNQLYSLPSTVGNLQSLKTLSLEYNNLTSIPSEINAIVTLEILILSNNQIEGSLNLSNLTVLNQLWISNNSFTSLKLNLSPTAFGNTANAMAYSFRVGSNDLGCIEVPTAEVVSWQLSGASLDANVIFSDDCGSENPTPQTEKDALIAFYNATNGASWTNATNWLSNEPISNWHGITVTGFNQVKKIDLRNNNLSGTLPSEIEDLPKLEVLRIVSNNVGGNLPAEIGNLASLKVIDLGSNNFDGSIPIELGNVSTLEAIVFGVNNFSGNIPIELGSLTNLKFLYLNENNLSGNIPTELGSLYNLEVLYLRGNSLDGPIPTSLSNLNNVYSMRLDNNNLSGTIPSGIQSQKLEYFSVSNNNLTGVLPNFSATPLMELDIRNNFFVFADIETYYTHLSTNIDTFLFAPMNTYDEEQFISLDGSDIILTALFDDSATSRNASSVNNIYQWFIDGQEINGATQESYTITNSSITDEGTYQCRVTNSEITGLIIWSNPFILFDDGSGGGGGGMDTDLVLKVFLQGPYNINTGLMTDDLRADGLISTTSPYADVITVQTNVFDLGGASGIGLSEDDIVDWIWVEIRDGSDGTTVIESTSALLQRDGDIVTLDGISSISISIDDGDYYIVISHRNHLGIQTVNAVSLIGGDFNLDVTTDSSLILGGTNAIKDMGNGSFALYAGDFNGDGQIQITDKNLVEPLRGTTGYSNADIDMNGEVQNSEINTILNLNLGRGEQFASRQLFAKRKTSEND